MKMVDVEKAVPMTCRMVRTIEVRRPVKRSSSCCHFSFVVTLFLIAALTYFTVQNYNCLERQSNRIMEQVNRNRADLITFGTLGYVLKSWGSPMPKNCEDYFKAGIKTSGKYFVQNDIYPDGGVVFCDFVDMTFTYNVDPPRVYATVGYEAQPPFEVPEERLIPDTEIEVVEFKK